MKIHPAGPRSLPNFPTNYDSAPAIASPSLVVVSPSPAAVLSPMSTAPPAVGQSPSVVDSAAPPFDDDLLNGASVLLASYEQQQQQLLAQSEAASASSDQAGGGSSLLKLKRPTSLTLPSREEYQPQTKKSPSQEQLVSPAPPAHSASVQLPEQVELPSPAALPAASSAPPPYAVDMDTSESKQYSTLLFFYSTLSASTVILLPVCAICFVVNVKVMPLLHRHQCLRCHRQ
jgi:hypothetical protein